MRPKRCLPPAEVCLGTNPIQPASPHLDRKIVESVTEAAKAVATLVRSPEHTKDVSAMPYRFLVGVVIKLARRKWRMHACYLSRLSL